jgi:hypothetical protein
LRAAHRTLALLPGFALAHWLAATVQVARQVFDDAERELVAGIASQAGQTGGAARFSSVALHWLLGLIHLARGDEARALEEFEIELASEQSGHLFARECCANTWYAIGALRLRQRRAQEAAAAFERAIERVAAHPMAHAGVAAAAAGRFEPSTASSRDAPRETPGRHASFEAALARAVRLVVTDAHADAARLVDDALAAAPPGNAGWILPVEPLVNVAAHPDLWAGPLARIRNRAA